MSFYELLLIGYNAMGWSMPQRNTLIARQHGSIVMKADQRRQHTPLHRTTQETDGFHPAADPRFVFRLGRHANSGKCFVIGPLRAIWSKPLTRTNCSFSPRWNHSGTGPHSWITWLPCARPIGWSTPSGLSQDPNYNTPSQASRAITESCG